jgi:hypothetical protein
MLHNGLQVDYNWLFLTMHMLKLHQMSSWERKGLGVLQTPLLCVRISL